jgi:hypothetical protein
MTALYVGGMGARTKNFYNEIFASLGYEQEAAQIQDLYPSGKKKEAEAAIPRSVIDATTLIGPRGFVRDRLAAYKESGVTHLNVGLAGRTMAGRVATLDGLNAIVATP